MGPDAAADSFPYLPTMDENIGSGLEAQFHLPSANFQDRDLKHGLEVVGAPDHDGFLAFSRQDQHRRTSMITRTSFTPAQVVRRSAADEQERLLPCAAFLIKCQDCRSYDGLPAPPPLQVSAGTPRASKNTCTTVP